MPPSETDYGAPQRVYVENEWYDGPRVGVADFDGTPHRFVSQFDEQGDEYLGTFLLWPVDPAELVLEQEQWQIFVNWNKRFEAGVVGVETHPGHPGINKRWEEIEALLKDRRQAAPAGAKRAMVQLLYLKKQLPYAPSGPNYQMRWKLV